MSKLTNSLVPSVKELIEALQVKILTTSEISADLKLVKKFGNMPEKYKGLYDVITDTVIVRDGHLREANEVVLHELIHWAGAESRLNRKWVAVNKAFALGAKDEDMFDYLDENHDTEEATAEIGMLKLAIVLGLNPAQFAETALKYLESLLDFNLAKADKDSDKAVEYLVNSLGMRKVA